jgi:hypothetical protein
MTNLDLAPPPVTVGGRTAVPIDISTIDADLRFDGAGGTATGDATVAFVVGPHAGCPIFDLRQPITGVWLDGAALTPAQVLTLDLGGGPGAELRVLDRVLAAGSAHTLRLTYDVGLPGAPPGGGHPPALAWAAGPRLTLTFGFTDLAAARYLESWVPANLIWDQYAITCELTVTGTAVAHRPITNGTVTTLGSNHWRVAFPARFTALSPMLEIRAVDTLSSATRTVTLPVSGTVVTVEAVKRAADTTADLNAALTDLAAWLPANELAIGRYLHGDRFTAFLIRGGMEYEGATTATAGTLEHEAFHSWWGRGVKPAAQRDGWWDEGWNVYHDNGGNDVDPFDFTEPPIKLASRNPYSRVTPTAAYPAGSRFFAGAAALASPSDLTAWMGEFYRAHLDRPTTTEALEAHLVARSGAPELVDGFHRWVHGFADPSPVPDLWIHDGDRFWDSPDLWIRHADDGGTTHQAPVAGRDNWFHARVRNRGAGVARHFVVTFGVKPFAGVQFSWPADFLPAITAATGFELGPGQEQIVTARWPAALVPPAGAHACWLAAVLARSDRPAAGAHVWEHGNLAQKNMTIVRARPGARVTVPFMARGLRIGERARFEIRRPPELAELAARVARRRGGDETDALALPVGPAALDLHLQIPRDARPRTRGTVDLVRLDEAGQVLGGIAVQVVVDR